jgi:hypothetical protein
MAKILADHAEIRAWAEARSGTPMLMDVPSGTSTRTMVQLTFGQHALNADNNEGPDQATGGFRMVTWDEWLTELDQQGLGLKVNDEQPGMLDNDFEFVARHGEGRTTDAARQPPAATVERPDDD